MQTYLLDMLACPSCHGELEWTIGQQANDRIEEAEAHCRSCSRSYPVREGIGVFLLDELERNDLWEQMESGLMKYFKSQPEQYEQLMSVPLESLSPADQFLRATLLEELGDFAAARQAHDTAVIGLYTAEYRDCSEKQFDYVIEQLTSSDGPIIDLASGRGYLVEKLVDKLDRPVVATDFSLQVLRQDRKRLELEGRYDRVSLLAFDARRTPFKDGALQTLTTNLGLPNIQDPGALLNELRRVVHGMFLAICHFFPEADQANGELIHQLNLQTFLYRRTASESFANAKWQMEIKNAHRSRTLPTPPSVVIEGMRMDGLPIRETELEWCTLSAS